MCQGAPIRAKGGLVNVLGYRLKYLFGTADAKDDKGLMDACDELHVFNMQMVYAADQQLTYLRSLVETTQQSTKDTIELAQVLRDVIKEFSVKLNRQEADLLSTQSVIEKQARYSAAIREVEMAILEMGFSLTQLQESLDLTILGKLSSMFISPYNLSVIL
jgi:NADH dehydrogenase/NADH:ubiquinone oxidoreductase subunit G